MKRIYTFHGTRILRYIHKGTPVDPILRLINLVHSHAFDHFKGSLVFPSTTTSLGDLLASGSSAKKFVYISQHSHVSYILRLSLRPLFDHPKIIL
jgi:hypothetical protein